MVKVTSNFPCNSLVCFPSVNLTCDVLLALQVLEQGVVAIPLSIDLWMYYINFAKDRYKGVAGEGRIRQ